MQENHNAAHNYRAGKGGSYIGKKLAKDFGIDLYDCKLLRLAAEDSGINETLFAAADENTRKTLLYRVSQHVYDGTFIPSESGNFISDQNLFNYQTKVLRELLDELLAKVDSTTHFVYWQVTRGVEMRNHVYAEDLPGKLWVLIRPNHLNDPDIPIKLDTVEDTRIYHCNIKTLNLLPSVVAAQHVKRIGVQETVLHRGDIVTECAHSNVSILKDGAFYSHANDEFILRGIAKTHMIAAC